MVKNALQAQLLKAGLVDNKKAKKLTKQAQHEQRTGQNDDAELKAEFTPIAKAMNENEAQIVKELTEVQGKPANTGGYYLFDDELTSKVMRPSATLNKIIG